MVDVPITDNVDSLGCELANVIGFLFDEDHSIISKVLSFIGITHPSAPRKESILVHCLHALHEVATIN